MTRPKTWTKLILFGNITFGYPHRCRSTLLEILLLQEISFKILLIVILFEYITFDFPHRCRSAVLEILLLQEISFKILLIVILFEYITFDFPHRCRSTVLEILLFQEISFKFLFILLEIITRNAMHCNYRDDLLGLSFTLEISIFSGDLYITQSKIYDGVYIAKI